MKAQTHSNSSPQNSNRHQGAGSVTSWTTMDNGIQGTTDLGHFRILVYSETTIRVQVSRFPEFDPNPYSVSSEPSECEFSVSETSKNLTISTEKITLQIKRELFTLTFLDKDGQILNEDDSLGTAWIGSEVTCYKKFQLQEKFVGLGEKTGNLNRFGSAYTNWNTDYFGYGIGDDPLYMSIPFYIGIHHHGAYGIFLDNTHKTVFNFGASTNRFTYFSAEDGDLDYYFIHDDSVSEIISHYTALTGRMEMPPKWALGFQQCRYSYYPDSEVTTLAKTFQDKDMPADVIYLDIHHMEEYKVFTFDGKKFPDAKSMITELKAKGFRVVVILDPGIKTQQGYLPYQEGLSKNLFVKYPDGEDYVAQVWPGWCAFPDFTKQETRSWWAEKMAFYTEAGVDGFWTDMNEPASWGQFTPNLIEFDFDGNPASHRKARNIYGMQMARSAQEGSFLNRKNERPFVLTRSGFAGIQRYAAAWTGDNVASEEHMLAGVRLVNSLGMSGVAFSGYDVGGFAGESTKSLFARWMSIGAFAPLYRAHSMINSMDAEPWAFGEEVEEISRNYMKLRYRLLPTIYSAFYQATLTGLPIASSLAIAFSKDQEIFRTAYQNEYLFCNRLLVAPVKSTEEISKVYLPEGNWYYLYSDEFYTGGKSIFIESPLNYLPVFVKEGSVLAMQSDISSTSEKHDGVLTIHVYLGATGGSHLHYEDDGNSLDYLNSAYLKREITYDPDQMNLKFGKSEGSFSSEFSKLKIFFHGFKTDVVTVNGRSASLQKETYAFLGRLSEFDPLPESEIPYFELNHLAFLELDHFSPEEIEISGLF